jgi:endonuclease-3 related protein
MPKKPMLPKRLIQETYARLLAAYGPQGWWPAETAFEMMVGAVLTQACSWVNVEKAIAALKSADVLAPTPILTIPQGELAALIWPTGYYNAKARKLKALAQFLVTNFDGDPAKMAAVPAARLREMLLGVHGVGEETADDIALYAAGKPVFVIDAYTRRLAGRLGLVGDRVSYGELSAKFAAASPRDTPGTDRAKVMGEYHALIVRHAKEACRKVPRCSECVLRDLCPTGVAARSAPG